jgi:holo-[acyl-carrier protein] synthase
MIVGIGNDFCHVDRIRRSLNRFGETYLSDLFSSDERSLCEAGFDRTLFYARAFCGKEACAKALGTGMSDGVGWRDIEVLFRTDGPELRLSGGAQKRLMQLCPAGAGPTLHVCCAGSRVLACAFVVISWTTEQR